MKIVRSVFVLLGMVTGMGVMLHPMVGSAQEMSLEEIMNRHVKACNMEAREQVQTIVMKGLRVQQDLMPMKIYQKRPNKYKMEFDVADLTAYQAYDGETAWTTAPWTGNTAPRVLQGAQAQPLIEQAEFDGMLYGWQEKLYKLSVKGLDTLETGIAYKLQLMQPDSTLQYYFIDATDFLLKKRLTFRAYQGQQMAIETWYKDYRDVEGIPFAFLLETYYPGRSVNTEIETIELNVPLEDSLFRVPEE